MEKYIVLQGYYDCYAVSNMGNVKNLRTGRVLQPSIRSDGYKSVLLSRDGKKMSIRVHQLVGQYFLELDTNKTYINHKNGIKHDNRSENLEWCTHDENMRHAVQHGLIKPTLTNGKVVVVTDYKTNEHLFTFSSVKQCCKFLNLNDSPVYAVIKGKRNHHHGYSFKCEDRI